jgi:hypothetical protein
VSGIGNTTVATGATLTATHIRQGTLTVNGTAAIRPNSTASGVSRLTTSTSPPAASSSRRQQADRHRHAGGHVEWIGLHRYHRISRVGAQREILRRSGWDQWHRHHAVECSTAT